MANRERQIRIYDLHSWTGVSLGIIMFFVCFTGSLALFHNEFKSWEDSGMRAAITTDPIPINDELERLIEENTSDFQTANVRVGLPHERRGYYDLTVSGPKKDGEGAGSQRRRISASTGGSLPVRKAGANQLLYNLHRDFAWPQALGGRTVGRALVGLVGVAFLLLILTGIVAHAKITKELFTLRYAKSVRLKWQDSHKVMGLWTSPFASMIALTGAFLGVAVLLLPLLAFVTVKGDTVALVEKLGIVTPVESAEVAAPMIWPDYLRTHRHPDTGAMPTAINYSNWGDASARATLTFKDERTLLETEQIVLSAVSGKRVDDPISFLINSGPFAYTVAIISPLHYGTYGGITLKIIYFILGIGISVMSVLGNMMWIERRRYGGEGSKSEKYYSFLSGINTGVCAGLPLAAVCTLAFNKLYWGTEATRYTSNTAFLFCAWAAIAAFAFSRGNDYKANREILMLVGVAMIALAPLNWVVTGDMMWRSFGTGAAASAWFDFAFIIIGAAALFVASKLPSRRPFDQRRQKVSKPNAKSYSELQPAG